MKIRHLNLLAFMLSVIINLQAKPQFGNAKLFNDNWKFILNDVEEGAGTTLDDSKWQTLDIPHDWSVKGTYSPDKASCQGFLPGGIGWYRKTFVAPTTEKGKKVFIYFEGVYNRSEVFINGVSVGKRPNGYISFQYDLSPYIKFGEENVLSVRVDHSREQDSRWYTGSGIYRDVYLVYANNLHLNTWGVYAYPSVAEKDKGVLQIQVELKNESAQKKNVVVMNELIAPTGETKSTIKQKLLINASETFTYKNAITVRNPQLWNLDNPVLYKLKTRVFADGVLIDESVINTGFRKFTFDPNKGFALNGKWMKMKGVCLHHDAGVLGAAFYNEVWERRILTLKELGVNAIRTSHNQQAPGFYELCDKLGVLVLNEAYDEWEFPKRKWLEGWNVGTPGFEGSYDFFEQWGERDLEDMVRRDRNHLSVFAWSIGNEVDYPNDPYSHPVLDGGKETGFTQAIYGGFRKDAPDAMRLGAIAKRLAAAVRRNDLSRPVTAGLAGVAMSNQTEYPAALDIAGYNYTEKMYHSDHKKYPARVIYGSETRHDLEAWKAVTDNEFIFGQFIWTGIDYLGESGPWPSRGFYSGLLDFGGFIKPRGYFRQSLWSEKPMAYIGTYPIGMAKNWSTDVLSQFEANGSDKEQPSMDAWPVWNYADNQLIRVVVYTNAAKARLLIDGQQIGNVKPYDTRTGIIFWDIPFKSGKLSVDALDANNNVIARYAIESSQRQHSLKAEVLGDKNPISGVCQIEIQAVDIDGNPVINADDLISCTIEGGASLLGMESGNNADMTSYTDNEHRLYHGKMIVYVRKTDKNNKVTLMFSAPWLQLVRIEI